MMKKFLTVALLAVVCACSGIDKTEEKFLRLDLADLIANVQNGAEVADIATIEREGVTVGYNVSFADGCALTLLNQAEGSVVTALTEDSGNYYLDIEGGEKITLPKSKTEVFTVEITGDEVELSDGGTVTATYKVTGAEDGLEVSAMVGEGWKADIASSSESEGTITVTAPDTLTADKVLVSFRDGSGKQVTRALRITSKSSVKRGNIDTYVFCGVNYSEIDPEQVDAATALRRYQAVSDAGIQIMEASGKLWWTRYDWYEEALFSLDLAEKVGLKLALCVDRLIHDDKVLASFVKHVKHHPALWGYQIYDEPSTEEFALLHHSKHVIDSLDGNHPCYINLHGYGCITGPGGSYKADSYEEYLQRYTQEVQPDFLSFDVYPCFPDWVLAKDWYPSLELVSSQAKACGLGFWAFAACCRFSDGYGLHCIPSVASIRLQDYTNLAYGAECLEYFTWSAAGDAQYNFSDWPTDANGDINTTNPTAEYVQTVNREVRSRAFVYDGCELKWAAHYNDIPLLCKELEVSQLPEEIMSFQSASDLLFTLIENDGGKSEYLNIVSRTHLKVSKIHLRFRYPVQTVERDGSLKSLNAGDYDFVIDPGDILIIKTK